MALSRQVVTQLDLRRAIAQRNDAVSALREDAARHESMIAVQRAIGMAGGQLETVLDVLVNGSLEAVGSAEGAVVELVEGDDFVYRAASGAMARHRGFRMRRAATISERCVLEGRAILSADCQNDDRIAAALAVQLGLGSIIVVPIACDGDFIGVLKLQSSRPAAFTDRDVRCAQMLAGAAAVGLSQVAVLDAIRTLQASEDRSRRAQEAGRIGTFDIEVASGEVRGSDQFWRLFGLEPRGAAPAELFQTLVVPEDRDRSATDMGRQDGSAAEAIEYRIRRADTGALRWIGRTAGFSADETGRSPRLVGTAQDITDRKQAEAAMARAQHRQRLATEAAGIGLWDYDPASGMIRADETCRAMFGPWPSDAVPLSHHLDTLHHEDRGRIAEALARALDPALGGEFRSEYRILGGKDGRELWVGATGHVTFADGQAIQLIGVAQDITRTKDNERRQAALIELGDALRDLDRMADIEQTAARIMGRALDVSRVGYGAIDTLQRNIAIRHDWTAPGIASIAGVYGFASDGTLLEDLEHGRPVAIDDAEALRLAAEAFVGAGTRAMLSVPILEHGKLVAIVFLHHNRCRIWSEEDVGFVRNAADRVRAAIARVRAEEEQRLVNRELGHRLKNTLTMVQAIASQTMRNAPTLEGARDGLAARLVALGQAHDILLSGGDDRADLRVLITGSLALGGEIEAARFDISGPDLVLGPKAALSVSLIIHELATNAAKYGALSIPEGRVDVGWRIDLEGGRELFRMTWSEHGGPTISAPSRRGFGSRLIERGLAGAVGGTTAITYDPAGVRCTLEAPLRAVMAEA